LNYRTPAEFPRQASYGKGVGSAHSENADGVSNFPTAATVMYVAAHPCSQMNIPPVKTEIQVDGRVIAESLLDGICI